MGKCSDHSRREMMKRLITCKCGNWYNTKVSCPECGTKADVKYDEKRDDDE